VFVRELELDLIKKEEFIANQTKRLIDELGFVARTT